MPKLPRNPTRVPDPGDNSRSRAECRVTKTLGQTIPRSKDEFGLHVAGGTVGILVRCMHQLCRSERKVLIVYTGPAAVSTGDSNNFM